MNALPQYATLVVIAGGLLVSVVSFDRIPVYPLAVALLLPATAAALHLILRTVLRRDISSHVREPVDAISLHVVIFIIALHVLVVSNLAAVGWARALGPRAVVILLGVVLVSAGNLLPRLRPNPGVGIRTTRTMDDPRLWSEVHRRAGYVAVAAGCAVALAGLFLSGAAIAVVVTICAVGSVATLTVAHWRLTHA